MEYLVQGTHGISDLYDLGDPFSLSQQTEIPPPLKPACKEQFTQKASLSCLTGSESQAYTSRDLGVSTQFEHPPITEFYNYQGLPQRQ